MIVSSQGEERIDWRESMDARQAPPRILRIATIILLIGIPGLLLWLSIAPPATYAHYQPWFQASFDFVLGVILASCGLFYHSWFATMMGVHKAPMILRFGPNSARLWYIVIGLVFLTLGVVGFLVHS
jgi:threonine/homoserine/homoserine lactone efflux protein